MRFGRDQLQRVEADGAVVEDVFVRRRFWRRGSILPRGAAQQRLQPHQQDVQVEGLGKIVVGALLRGLPELSSGRLRAVSISTGV